MAHGHPTCFLYNKIYPEKTYENCKIEAFRFSCKILAFIALWSSWLDNLMVSQLDHAVVNFLVLCWCHENRITKPLISLNFIRLEQTSSIVAEFHTLLSLWKKGLTKSQCLYRPKSLLLSLLFFVVRSLQSGGLESFGSSCATDSYEQFLITPLRLPWQPVL